MLSTEELVNAALDYPFKPDYLMFDSYTMGIEHLKNTSNVYWELFGGCRKSYSNIYWLDYPTNYANATSHFTSRGTNVKITYSNSYIILYDSTGPVHSVRSVGVSSGSNLSEWQTSVKVESKLGQRGVFETTLADMMALYGASYYKVYTLK